MENGRTYYGRGQMKKIGTFLQTTTYAKAFV
jgi:hypothetical protein